MYLEFLPPPPKKLAFICLYRWFGVYSSTPRALQRVSSVSPLSLSLSHPSWLAGPEVYGNCNAPPAVTTSAIIYSLRCMVGGDIPLNQGCLAPITITIPPSCLLNPSPVGPARVNHLLHKREFGVHHPDTPLPPCDRVPGRTHPVHCRTGVNGGSVHWIGGRGAGVRLVCLRSATVARSQTGGHPRVSAEPLPGAIRRCQVRNLHASQIMHIRLQPGVATLDRVVSCDASESMSHVQCVQAGITIERW